MNSVGVQGTPPVPFQSLCSYEFFLENRYTISEFTHSHIHYQAICNNGFIKLYQPQMRAYWHLQNEFGHKLRDWKFHVSVAHSDLPKAWNLLSEYYVKSKCRGCMKTAYLKQSNIAIGRQITIYIYKYEQEYQESPITKHFGLSWVQEHSDAFWLAFCEEIEDILKSNNIKPNGLAIGDLKLGSFEYVSLRNESFVWNPTKSTHQYPPDECGWNPNGQEVPFDLDRFGVEIEQPRFRSIWAIVFLFGLLII